MVHMRRDFYEFHASTKSPLAAEVLAQVQALYAIESQISGHSAEHRRQARQERSRPVVEPLHAWLQAHQGRVSATSDLAKAIRYALRHWPGLTLFLDDGRVEMGRVEDRRGGCSLPVGLLVPLSPTPAVRADMAPSPVPARQTGRADFPHP